MNKEVDHIYKEVLQYLVSIESAPITQEPGTEPWNEVHAPGFRNYKIFVNQVNTELLIVIPSHTLPSGIYAYHVLRENLADTNPNGEYSLMTADEMRGAYDFTFADNDDKFDSHSLGDLADFMLDNMAEIKKMKTRGKQDRAESMVKMSMILKDFFKLP